MRLGVVLAGVGVRAAAGIGVMRELSARGMEPCAVCALGAGAWPAALYAAGLDAQAMTLAAMQAQRMGKRMLGRARAPREKDGRPVYRAERMTRLLTAQTGGRLLALCPRRAAFPLYSPRLGLSALCTRGFETAEGFAPVMQASAAFAARAAMGLPPYLSPMEWLGAPLLPVYDAAAGVRLARAAGAQRVLIVEPESAQTPDALLTAGMAAGAHRAKAGIEGAALLRVTLPPGIRSLSFEGIMDCVDAGEAAARRELDRLLEAMGMAHCRVLPFKRPVMESSSRLQP